ncbi:opsin 6, group member b [Hypomesus transpacificus]|uniref:opsin 6, group member b n=1 Tax=Hypomesus transpacificus TaxID=137520 RepID=UPI001F077D93|nr:opsin 6, group member b [Hypomesus transpacificus]
MMENHGTIYRNNISVYQVSDEGETAIGVYLIFLGWLSWIGNGVVILMMTKQRHYLEPSDLLTYNLAVSDAGIAMFGYSRGILEVFNVLNDDGQLIRTLWTCQVDGFLILLFGLISINTLTAIGIIRYIKACQPQYVQHITKPNVAMVIGSVWLSALFWSGAPLVGWGSYTSRKYGTCEIDWVQARYSVPFRLYVLLIFIFNFFIPVSTIVFSYVSIIRTVNSAHKSSKGGEISERQRQMERSITRVSLLLAAAFLLAWSPYAVISMCAALGYEVPPLTSILASLFAKSASFYNPIIYLGMSAKFRENLMALVHWPWSCPACLGWFTFSQTPMPLLPRPLRPDEVQVNVEVAAMKGEEGDGHTNLDSGVELGAHNESSDGGLGEARVEERGEEAPMLSNHSSSLIRPAHGFLRRLSNSGRL